MIGWGAVLFSRTGGGWGEVMPGKKARLIAMYKILIRRLAAMTGKGGAGAAPRAGSPPRHRGRGRSLVLAAWAALVLLLVLPGGVGPVSDISRASAQGTCTDSWVGPAKQGTYPWSVGRYWSKGAPPDGGVACINEGGTYTVVITHSADAAVGVAAVRLGASSGDPTLEVYANNGGVTLTLDGGAITVGGNGAHGTLAVHATTVGGVLVTGTPGVRGAALTVASGGKLSVSGPPSGAMAGGGVPLVVQVPFTNRAGGTVDLGAGISVGLNNLGKGAATVNSGTFNITPGAHAMFNLGSTFTQSAGTLQVDGTLYLGGAGTTFTLAGGAERGRPVDISAGATLVEGRGQAVGFDMTSACYLTGDIPAGQTVTVDGRSINSSLALNRSATVKGALALEASNKSWADVEQARRGASLTIASGGKLSVSGPPAGTAVGGGVPLVIAAPLTNLTGGTVNIAARMELGPATFDNRTASVNSGTLDIRQGGLVILGSSSTLANKATGMLGVTVAANPRMAWGISGSGVYLGGTLAVTTLGSPARGSSYIVIGGPVTGRFSAYVFNHEPYSVRYTSGQASSNEVLLVFR